jgi:hypothetical protein
MRGILVMAIFRQKKIQFTPILSLEFILSNLPFLLLAAPIQSKRPSKFPNRFFVRRLLPLNRNIRKADWLLLLINRSEIILPQPGILEMEHPRQKPTLSTNMPDQAYS